MRTSRTRRLPLFYTHPIGSLPRPQMVRELFTRREELSADRFDGLLDDFVRFAIHLQELAGSDVVSDGEWRRVQYIREFLLRVGGFECCRRYEHQGETKVTEVVVLRMRDGDPVFAADARFLDASTDRVTKFALPSPFLIAVRYWHADHTGELSVLTLLPSHLAAGLGVIDVRSERLQSVEEIEQLAKAGAAIIAPDRIALNPDCGFAPDAGEPPTIDEAYEKLKRLVAAAQRLRALHPLASQRC